MVFLHLLLHPAYDALTQKETEVLENSDKASTPTDDSRRKIKARRDGYIGTSDWSACFIDFFGEDAFEKFYNYCVYGDDEHEMCIDDDLHAGNIGFRADGSPVLLDYSGWACE